MKRLIAIAIMVSLMSSAAFAQDVTAKRQAAEQAAQNWLTLLDRGEYGKSWKEAAPFLQSKISETDWQRTLDKVRSPLGAVGHRTVTGSMYETALPNAPEGEYVVIQYLTEFAVKGRFVETVTPMLGKDGTWRVSGYYIKPAQ